MALYDSPTRYGLLTRTFHWLMAGLLVWQLTGMVLKQLLGRHELVAMFVRLHQPLGLVLLSMALLRLVWAISNRSRRPHAGGTLAAAGQKLLYVLMVVVPCLGILRAGSRGVPAEEAGAMAALGSVHSVLAWSLLVLIAGHILMALLHAFVWRDGATDAMLRHGRE